jgi:hypothetical protein
MPVTTEHARQLIARNAELARRMGDLAIEAANVATALASRGTPAPEPFVQELAEAGRLFTVLRAEVFAAASSLSLPLPALETVDCTSKLDTMLAALLASVEAAERRAAIAAARAAAVEVLERVSRLAHRETPEFEPLRACQETARKLRMAIAETAETTEIDAEAIAPFAALLEFIDSQHRLDDQEWGALQEAVSDAFGLPLATAAGRGRLVGVS